MEFSEKQFERRVIVQYQVYPTVHEGGIAKTGLAAVIRDADATLTVPWESTNAGTRNIVWTVKSDNGKTYTITVPVTITVTSGSTTVSYTKGTYSIGG